MGGPISILLSNPLVGVVVILSIILAISIHEYAHAKMADFLGDPTPGLEGRLTIDPRAHLDIFGSIMILLVGFGWGKPVRFDQYNLKNPRKDAMKIAFVGPLSNIMMALLASIILKLIQAFSSFDLEFVVMTLQYFIQLNIGLAIFNLLPVEPLDGFKVVAGLLPENQAQKWQTLAPYGMIFLVLLVFIPPAPGLQLVTGISRWIMQFLL